MPAASSHSCDLKVAIACTGIDQVQRGMERQFRDLFLTVRDDLDATLFKGGGTSGGGERRLPCLRRTGWLRRVFPLHRLLGRQDYHAECLTFGFALHRALERGDFDLVHVVDAPLAKALVALRNRAGARYRILYMEGTFRDYALQPRVDFLQHVTRPNFEAARAHGYTEEGMDYLPPGFFAERFAAPPGGSDREALRRAHGVDPDTFVVLDVGALNRDRKRMDHLLREARHLEGDFLVWIDGSPEDEELVREARRTLGERCRITQLPSERVGELYHLADVMAHASILESFGLVVVEAMSAGLPVLVHDSEHFRWLVESPACLVDMAAPGVLGRRLEELRRAPVRLAELAVEEHVWRRFDWNELQPRLLELYRRAAAAPQGAHRVSR